MFLLFSFLLLNSFVTSSQYQDCTNNFKNQIAMFEYLYYPGWWSAPRITGTTLAAYGAGIAKGMDLEFTKSIPKAKANKNIRHILHDCGEDTVCIECLKDGFDALYIKPDIPYTFILRPSRHTTLHDVKKIQSYKHKIYCTSCQPEADIYHDCQIYNFETQKYWYTKRSGSHEIRTLARGSPNWFKWRIVSPPTRVYWAVSNSYENCQEDAEDLPAHASFESSISNSVTDTSTVAKKISVGLEGIPLLKALGETTVSWSEANVSSWAKSVTTTVGSAGTKSKMVKPGMKWVVEQFVGEAAFNTIKSTKYRSCDIPCSSNSDDCSSFY